MTRNAYELEDAAREETLGSPDQLQIWYATGAWPQLPTRETEPEELPFETLGSDTKKGRACRDSGPRGATLTCTECDTTFPAAGANGEACCSSACKESSRRNNIPYRRSS